MSLANSVAISGPLISARDQDFEAGPCGSRHDADAPIDVGDRAGEPAGKRRGQERGREADIVNVDQLADGRALAGFVQKKVKVLQTRRSPGLERPWRDGVNADVLLTELI